MNAVVNTAASADRCHLRGLAKRVMWDCAVLHKAAEFLEEQFVGRIEQSLGNWLPGGAIAARVHCLDLDDTLLGQTRAHLSCSLFGALCQLARDSKADYASMLDAYISGFEAAGDLGLATGEAHARVWHPTATLGTVAVAVASAQFLGGDAAAQGRAAALGADQASGTKHFLHGSPDSKWLHPAGAVSSGLLAGRLALEEFHVDESLIWGEKGFLEAFGGNRTSGSRGLNAVSWLVEDQFKSYACMHGLHSMVEFLSKRDDWRRVMLDEGGTLLVELPGDRFTGSTEFPKTSLEGRMSGRFVAAVTLLFGDLPVDGFGAAVRSDERIVSLYHRVEVRHGNDFPGRRDNEPAARLELRTPDGVLDNAYVVLPEQRWADSGDLDALDQLLSEKHRRLPAVVSDWAQEMRSIWVDSDEAIEVDSLVEMGMRSL